MHEKGIKSRFELYPTKQNQYFVYSTVLFEDLLHTEFVLYILKQS